ncbi:CDP-diacylglycerol--glycerol-3-phosphate 3-phosphatidyltransferase, mitochondrial [Contarinia nasturtii]|uniref:CDP-diacylglycerol--glycerol-3-phosphate 3-phosphatidyltransferase, mitochondrial n=1 Tax=Contarinia nasturtii TaxID=265458 RepID=UPI0012D3E7BD|nr:CDP-diacylglycerol--glycerol-3-phosphate 3-phosphatidyltransferase, mitochondrial [Contarinia nasturtii]
MLRRIFSTIADSTPQMDKSPFKGVHLTGSFGVRRLESLDWLHSMSVCFPLQAGQIEIITEPQIFYTKLQTLCVNAANRIGIASLYFGTDQLESQLVKDIEENVCKNSQLKVNILIDFTRGTRGEGKKTSSKQILQQIMNSSTNTSLSLYHTPKLRGLKKRVMPDRWNELIGLQHMKIYVADQTVIISGANLSNDYFKNRQDRYIMINDKHLSDFYYQLIEKVKEFSVQVSSDNKYYTHSKWNMLSYEDDQKHFIAQANDSICKFFAATADEMKYHGERYCSSNTKIDTWVFPLIEMGQLNIHHDSVLTENLLLKAVTNSRINLTTGYFNLTQTYMDTLATKCQANCDILMAHPNANGFQGAKGPAGGIPAAYSQISKNFLKKLIECNESERIKLYEYQRSGWTYHAKGLWYYLPGSYTPDLTLIGSSNFGERSVNRDLESQICLVTVNDELRRQLQREYVNLKRYCSPAEEELQTRIIPKWVKTAVVFFKNFF